MRCLGAGLTPALRSVGQEADDARATPPTESQQPQERRYVPELTLAFPHSAAVRIRATSDTLHTLVLVSPSRLATGGCGISTQGCRDSQSPRGSEVVGRVPANQSSMHSGENQSRESQRKETRGLDALGVVMVGAIGECCNCRFR
jgi:hypothetical protein